MLESIDLELRGADPLFGGGNRCGRLLLISLKGCLFLNERMGSLLSFFLFLPEHLRAIGFSFDAHHQRGSLAVDLFARSLLVSKLFTPINLGLLKSGSAVRFFFAFPFNLKKSSFQLDDRICEGLLCLGDLRCPAAELLSTFVFVLFQAFRLFERTLRKSLPLGGVLAFMFCSGEVGFNSLPL